MVRGRVRLLHRSVRSRVVVGAAAAVLAASGTPGLAHGATGGAGGAGAVAPATVSAPAAQPAAPGEQAVATPIAVGSEGTPTASQSAVAPLLPRLPVLATAARTADDPLPTDLAALATPSGIAAIDGHVVVVRERMSHSELVDLADPDHPRVLLVSTRPFGTPQSGRDGAGRAVVVVSPCAGAPAVVQSGGTPRCPLRAVDLITGASRALPGSTGALAGDLAGDRFAFTRLSPIDGVRLYLAAGSAPAGRIDLPTLGKSGDGWTPASGVPMPGTVRAPLFDVDDTGRLAVVLEYGATKPRFSSGLWLRSAAGAWRRLTTIGTTRSGMGARHVLGPRLDPVGTSAYVEGVVEAPSFVGRWTDDGDQTLKQSVRRSIGRSTILMGTAYDGQRLLFVDWLPGAPCGEELEVACGLRSLAPVRTAP